MPASENARATVGKCPELLFPPAPCPRMMPVLAVDFGASTVAVYIPALPGSEYSSIGMLSMSTVSQIHTEDAMKVEQGVKSEAEADCSHK